ncbi:DUF547 domain-containing protein [Paraglaciecola aestuariivivens]
MKLESVIQLVFLNCVLFFLTINSLNADELKVLEPFAAYSRDSTYTISYDDLDQIYKASVLNTGMSKRAKARKSTATIGSRIKTNVKRLTALESNRFFFESFKTDEQKALLTNIRKSLETLPTTASLKHFSKTEQLAYWLNLYNVTVLDELLKIYPEKYLEDFMEDLVEEKLLEVEGVKLSLNDIQYKILLPKYERDPLIIYGLYQGYIGSPSLRNRAYTGENVYNNLKDNAYEFINSNRGTYAGNKGVFRTSSFYSRNKAFFPNFNQDLREHLELFLMDSMRYKLENAKKIRTNISNWEIADVYGTMRREGSSAAVNNAALMDAGSSSDNSLPDFLQGSGVFTQGPIAEMMLSRAQTFGRFTKDQALKLQALNNNRLLNTGSVTVTDIEKDEDKDK